MTQLASTLLELFPLPPGSDPTPPAQCPHSRVSFTKSNAAAFENTTDPLDADPKFHNATMSCNKRLTAEDWYQDVRHFELDFEDDIA